MNRDKVAFRGEKGGIVIDSLNLQILLDDIFMIAKTEEEVEYLEKILNEHVELAKEEAEEYLLKEDN